MVAGPAWARDFAQEAELGGCGQEYLPRSVQKGRCPAPDPQWPRDVLLTGSTGFLGAHLLSDPLAATPARVWCLVRAGDAAHARQRIAEAAARYDLPAPPGDRVVPLPGNLTLPRLGLSPGLVPRPRYLSLLGGAADRIALPCEPWAARRLLPANP